jgi:hypothetical protein
MMLERRRVLTEAAVFTRCPPLARQLEEHDGDKLVTPVNYGPIVKERNLAAT